MLLDIAKKRYSVRDYNGKPVEKEKLETILEAAHVAPTAANAQPVRLLVVQSAEGLKKLSKAANVYGAPCAVIACADRSRAWVRPYDQKSSADIDASILTDHMMLAATELGLGTTWVCYFKPEVLAREFGLPETLEPVNIIAVGYTGRAPADPERHDKTRIPRTELVAFEHF